MSIFNKEEDFTKPDKVSKLLDESVEITVDHCKGETWRFTLGKSKLDLFYNGLTACFSGTCNYVLVKDPSNDTFIFGSELLKNSCISIIK